MASNSDDFTPQQYRKFNGQAVFKALGAMGSEASADELANFISQDIGTSEKVILPEVKNVLRRGITNGFLQRNGQFYSLISDESNMHVDSVRQRTSSRSSKKGRPSKRSRSNLKWEENVSEDVDEEEKSDQNEDEYDDPEEMQTDTSAMPHPPKVRLYEVYQPPMESETDDEQSEGTDEDDEYDNPPPQKRIRLLPISIQITK